MAGNAVLGLLLGGDGITEQRPGAGHQGAVLITQALGVEVACGGRGEDHHRLADHRDQRDGASDQPPRQLRGDVVLEIAIEILPMGFSLLLAHLVGAAQGQLREAALVRPLLEGGGDR